MLLFVCLALLIVSAQSKSSYPYYFDFGGEPYDVTYDVRSLRLNDKPAMFTSGSIHYPRSSPDRWPELMKSAVNDGLNMIETYVFWNVHQPDSSDQMIMDGNANITRFLSEAAAHNLFVNLRFGPYVCAEQNMGGLPVWLQYVPDIAYRCSNTAWTDSVHKWMDQIVEIVRPFFAKYGGPIILAQIENELNGRGVQQSYVSWNGQLALSYDLSVPWLMCNGASDYPRTINACNGRDCTKWLETNGQSHQILITQPAIWTENEAWFEQWGDTPSPHLKQTNDRAPAEIAYSTMRFYARGGSLMNYYMYFGSLNYGRLGGGSMIQYYADGANYRGDFTPNEPKRSHLNEMHAVIQSISDALLYHPAQLFLNKSVPYQPISHAVDQSINQSVNDNWLNSSLVNAFYYGDIAFIENARNQPITVLLVSQFTYFMEASSIIVLQYTSQSIDQPVSQPVILWNSSHVANVSTVRDDDIIATIETIDWLSWNEPIIGMNQSFNDWLIDSKRPLEQLSLVGDTSDYLMYSTQFTIKQSINQSINQSMILSIDGTSSQSFIALIDGVFVGESNVHTHNTFPVPTTHSITINQSINQSNHILSVLSVNFGNENGVGAGEKPLDVHYKGVQPVSGKVMLGDVDLTNQHWIQMPGLIGERLNATIGNPLIDWQPINQSINQSTPLTWFTGSFKINQLPESSASFYIDMLGMTRGHVYVNGFDVARYWLILSNIGLPSQQRYHVPTDVILINQPNILVIFDELGGADLSTVKVLISRVKVVPPVDEVAYIMKDE